ncbi:MAG: RNA-directed DNA polymerase [Deltaproteobacteria bacterium]|nr:RNA-directed DNA polymerase [Deltaproteobacteria bacterium]
MQDGQTLGIPIGPDTSRVISEIIGVALDKTIQSSEPELNWIRFIDDFFLFADSYAQAEILELKINRALSNFELTNNENKSSIQAMPVTVESIKFQTIKNYKIRKSVSEQKLDIIHIYNLSIELYKIHPHENSFHCFLTKILPVKIHKVNWDIIESILLQIASTEIKSITVISKLLISYKSYGYDLNLEKIKISFLKIAQRGVENNFGFEVCWALFILDQLEIKINEKINNLSSLSDPLAILSVLTAREKGFYTYNLDLNYWNTLMSTNGLYDSCWILCYEAEKRDWLNNQNGLNLTDSDDYFKKLKALDISFLNMDCTINPIDESELSDETDSENEPNIFELIYK